MMSGPKSNPISIEPADQGMKPNHSLNHRVRLAFVAALMVIANGYAQAQSAWPARAVTLVVGFSAGGSTDLLARTLAREFAEEFKESFIVENKPGANSNLAMTFVARAKADGYTLLMVPFGLAVNQFLYKNLGYDIKSFEPIALVAKVPNVIVVNKNLSVNSVQELVAYSRMHPTEITFASPGIGSSLHLAGELFKLETKAMLLHIPYSGSAPALMAVRSGDVKSAFDNLSTAAPFIKNGDMKALAVTSEKRSPAFPDIPTVGESGFPKYQISSFFGLAAPAGTPPDIVRKLNAATMRALEKPAIKAQLSQLGAVTEVNTPEQFKVFLNSENSRWGDVIRQSDIQPN